MGLIQTKSQMSIHPNSETLPAESWSEKEKRKKIIKWSIIGAVILIIVVLAIVLPLVLIKHDDNPVDPPLAYYNPYKIDWDKDVK